MDTREWQTTPNAPIIPGTWFSLWNIKSSNYVAYGSRKYGINLKWFPRNGRIQPNFMVKRQSNSQRDIRYSEALAFKEKQGGYVYYKKRKYGINLKWDRSTIRDHH